MGRPLEQNLRNLASAANRAIGLAIRLMPPLGLAPFALLAAYFG